MALDLECPICKHHVEIEDGDLVSKKYECQQCENMINISKPDVKKEVKEFIHKHPVKISLVFFALFIFLIPIQMEKPQANLEQLEFAIDNTKANSLTMKIAISNQNDLLKKHMVPFLEIAKRVEVALNENNLRLLNLSPQKDYLLNLTFFFSMAQKKLLETGETYYKVICRIKGSVSSERKNIITISGECKKQSFDVKKSMDFVIVQSCLKVGKTIVKKIKNKLQNVDFE